MSNSTSDSGIKRFEDLRWRYLIALSAIALTIIISQVLLQFYISQQESDSIKVNLSGRQRMLSQRITKSALLFTQAKDSLLADRYKEELRESLTAWTHAHRALMEGDAEIGIKGTFNTKIIGLFQQIQGDFEEIVAGGNALLTLPEGVPSNQTDIPLNRILSHESSFLEGMDQIVDEFDREAQLKIARLREMELFLFGVVLIFIFLEVRFFFWPSAKLVIRNFEELAAKESKARSLALELSALYESLEKSYLDLSAVEVELEDLTLFASCTPEGDFTFFADKFSQIMEFEAQKPANFFGWLEKQGYESRFVSQIRQLVLEGKTWQGDLKLVNEEGDFVWLKLHLVPTLGAAAKVVGLLLISVDETEAKEAQTRSQEIYKEKLDKKLKEQQYRSALILEGQEEERKRISRDLHDGIGQYMTALKFSLEGIKDVKTFQEENRLKVSKKLVADVIKEVRRVSFHLTPVALSDYGIPAVLHKFSEEMGKISKIPVVFENKTGFISRMEPKIENNIYRIVQEAVNNAVKYSEAEEIRISLSHNSKFLLLEIIDDGIGFDMQKLKEEGHFKASGHGIFNIRERVNFVNGQFELTTAPGEGTRMSIEIPLDQ